MLLLAGGAVLVGVTSSAATHALDDDDDDDNDDDVDCGCGC